MFLLREFTCSVVQSYSLQYNNMLWGEVDLLNSRTSSSLYINKRVYARARTLYTSVCTWTHALARPSQRPETKNNKE